ncbi:MAG: 2-oxoacid:acceptor oxidoreductase subunit alpha [Anaerolineales bacterium]|nr:2-oxoacid:acceptor oxidoreductase subunit alpha [Anaerolineales bacterium]
MTESVATKEMNAGQAPPERVVNDFSMVVATVNGSGSQTSNMALIRALFRMGIPISGKNLFPSNIQGLPTWFTIRASSDGYIARRDTIEILVAMNHATFLEDLKDLVEGGVCFYPDHFAKPDVREDVIFYRMPVQDIIKEADPPRELRDYMSNMVYVGVVAKMMGIETDEIRAALDTHFRGKEKPIKLNMEVVEAAIAWAGENLVKEDRYYVERDNQTEGMILIDGNTAAGLGAIYGGVSFVAWYPITPASSLADALTTHLPRLRKDPETGLRTYAVIQAEDELAASGMAIGAGWAGARSMTSTSGPGISLMAEFAGLAYYAEIPVVIWDVQRMGPSTGLPTRTSQGDILFLRFLGHGDTQQTILLPGNMEECFEFGWRAFDLAERLQMPIFIVSDLDLGMNLWMSEQFEYPQTPMDRGKVLTAEQIEEIGEFARYWDVDGDGIAYRTLPGNEHPKAAYFARGTGHDERAIYSERPEDYEQNMERISRKLETGRRILPKPVIDDGKGAEIGLISYGSTDSAIEEGRDRLAEEGIETDYMRIRAIPFSDEVADFIRSHERVYVIEMNNDGQVRMLLQLHVPDQAAKLQSLTHNNGLPISARWINDAVMNAEGR